MKDLVEHPKTGLLLDFSLEDFGGSQQNEIITQWQENHHVDQGEFICHIHRDHERPWLYLQQRGDQIIAAHWPGTTLAGTHQITYGPSDEHKRQVDYLCRAGEMAGHTFQTEVPLHRVTPDAVIYGPSANMGVEVQRSSITAREAKSRTTKARRAGVGSVWFADSGTNPSWLWQVPGVRMNPDIYWDSLPRERSVTVVSGVRIIKAALCKDIPNNQCPNYRRGCHWWHTIHEPRLGTLVDDLAELVPAGELVPMIYKTFSEAQYIFIVSPDDKARYAQITGRSGDLPLRQIRERTSQIGQLDCTSISAGQRSQAMPQIPQEPCCGEHHPGILGQPLILACQLCPNSPTYWRRAG